MNIYNLQNPEIKYSFSNLTSQINAKRENAVYDTNGNLSYFKDASGKNNVAYPRGDVDYCPMKQVITLPPKQHLEIYKPIGNRPFTIAMVVNMYNFMPAVHYNYLIGGNCGKIEILFVNNYLILQSSCRTGKQLWYNMETGKGISDTNKSIYPSIQGDKPHIYVIKMDSNANITVSIDGRICINNEFLEHDSWGLENIWIGRGIWSGNYSHDPIDFYEFMYFDDFYSVEKQQFVEEYLEKKWGLNVLPTNQKNKIA
jgi:hypothetical protein